MPENEFVCPGIGVKLDATDGTMVLIESATEVGGAVLSRSCIAECMSWRLCRLLLQLPLLPLLLLRLLGST